MSYDTEKVKLGREPFTFIGLVVDKCSLVAGTLPCTATETGDEKCYNTRSTCNDPTNYTKTTIEHRFCQPRSTLPVGIRMFPVLDGKISKSGTSTTAGTGLGKRAVIRAKLKDFPHHDRGIDPYVSDRTYNPSNQGTFWGKFLKRNPYYEGRTIKIYHGYIGTIWSESDFEVQEYDITDITGPDNGYVNITGKDVLVRTYDDKAQYPVLSKGALLAGITNVATTATLTPTGIGNTDYPTTGLLSIGKEAIAFTRASDVLTLTRAQWGTEAKPHDADDTVQLCVEWNTSNIIDVLDELLVTGAGLPSSYIPTADWIIERDLWMGSANVKGVLLKPEPIEKVIGELSEVFMFDIWWDATAQEVKIKSLSPEPSGVAINTLSDGNNIIIGSLNVDRKSKDRYTRIIVRYNKINFSEDNKKENFASVRGNIDLTLEDADHYDSSSIKTINSRWFDATSNASQLSGRLRSRFANTPEIVTFKLDNKDHGKLSMAGRIELDSWQFQDESGANELRRFQVLEISETEPGSEFMVKCLTSSFVGRYAFIAPADTVDYGTATKDQKNRYSWICQTDGLFADSTTGYKII